MTNTSLTLITHPYLHKPDSLSVEDIALYYELVCKSAEDGVNSLRLTPTDPGFRVDHVELDNTNPTCDPRVALSHYRFIYSHRTPLETPPRIPYDLDLMEWGDGHDILIHTGLIDNTWRSHWKSLRDNLMLATLRHPKLRTNP